MFLQLPYAEMKFDDLISLEEILNTKDIAEKVFFSEVYLKKTEIVEEVSSSFPICSEKKNELLKLLILWKILKLKKLSEKEIYFVNT